jgi:hypothetical protein
MADMTYKECIINSLRKETYEEALKGYTKLIEQCIFNDCKEKGKEKCRDNRVFYYHNRGYVYLRKDDYLKAITDFNDALKIFLRSGKIKSLEFKARCISETFLSLSIACSKIEDKQPELQSNQKLSYYYVVCGILNILQQKLPDQESDWFKYLNNILNIFNWNKDKYHSEMKKYLSKKNIRDFVDILGRLYFEIGKNYDPSYSSKKLKFHRKCLEYAKVCFDVIEQNKGNNPEKPRKLTEYNSRVLANLMLISLDIFNKDRSEYNKKQIDDYMKILLELENDTDRLHKTTIVEPREGDDRQDGHNLFYQDLITFNELLYVSRTNHGYNDNWLYKAFLSYQKTFPDIDDNFWKEANWFSFKYFISFLTREINNALMVTKSILNERGLRLFKFYSLNNKSFSNLLENIKNNEIFFSSPYFYLDNKNETRAYETFLDNLPKFSYVKELFSTLKPYDDTIKEKNPIASECSYAIFPCVNVTNPKKDNINLYQMWSNYATEYSGICIEYRIKNICNNAFDFDPDIKREDGYKKVIANFCRALRNIILINPIKYNSKIQFDRDIDSKGTKFNISGYLDTLFFSKPEDWRAENELRIVTFFNTREMNRNNGIQTVKKLMLKDYEKSKVPLIIGKIKRIIFGYKFHGPEKKGDIGIMTRWVELLKGKKEDSKWTINTEMINDIIIESHFNNEIENFGKKFRELMKTNAIENIELPDFSKFELAYKKAKLDQAIDDLCEKQGTEAIILSLIMNESDLDDLVTFHKLNED